MMIESIILAAGFSSRAGAFKMELSFGEKKLIERVIESIPGFVSRIIIVTGHQHQRIENIARLFPSNRVITTHNRNYERGMFSSVREGVRRLEGDAFFIMPGDFPFITPRVFDILLKTLETSDQGINVFIPTFNGRKGHPVLMKKPMVKEILDEPVDSTLKTVINRNRFFTVGVGHEGILIDIDTPGDYENAKARLRQTETGSSDFTLPGIGDIINT
jgi:molybdenum cofactor cytidylyltransferase